MPSIYRTADGVSLNAVDSGGQGTPMVLQHGLGGDEKQTAEVFPEGPRFQRLTLECRGHGLSEAGPPENFSLAQFTEDLAGFIESRFSRPVLVGGISMGAAISLRLAVVRPDLVRGLVLARPAWLLEPSPPNMQPNVFVGALLEQQDRAEARAAFESSPIAETLAIESPDNLSSLRGFFGKPDRGVLAALLRRISADGPGVEEQAVRRLTLPALVLGTDRDYVHPFGYAETLAAMLGNARLVKLPSKSESRVGYVTGFRAALAEFIERVPAAD